jgi:hypothetical protein
LDFNLENFEELINENQILKKQIKIMEDFVIETRDKNLSLVSENDKLHKILKIKFLTFFSNTIKRAYRRLKVELFR